MPNQGGKPSQAGKGPRANGDRGAGNRRARDGGGRPLGVAADAPYAPWERDANDTPASFVAFTCYRDCPHPRNLRRAAAWYYHDDPDAEAVTPTQEGQFQKWSMTYDWFHRVQAYDLHLDAIKRKAFEKKLEELAEKRAVDVDEAIWGATLANKALVYKAANMPIEETGLTDLSVQQLMELNRQQLKALPALMKVERLVHGEPTDIKHGKVEHELRTIKDALRSGEGRDLLARVGELVIEHDPGAERLDQPGQPG